MKVTVFAPEPAHLPELLTRARTLEPAAASEVAWLGPPPSEEQRAELALYGAGRILVANHPSLASLPVEAVAPALAALVGTEGPALLLVASDIRGREAAPRAAHLLSAGCVVDALDLRLEDDRLVADRYGLGGATVATERLLTEVGVVAVFVNSVAPEPAPAPGAAQVETVDLELPAPRLKVVELKPKPAATVDIEAAEVLVTVGRGVARKEDLALVEALAATLGGEVGCTRPLSHDLHWLLESRMVGISGKRASPRLNVALGLSGQIQHSVGIMGAKLIVAVNKDKSAPIFQLADYGVVGDLYEVVPALLEELGKS